MTLQDRLDYWKNRCLAAEAFIEESPCDPDITSEQFIAYGTWQTLKEHEANYEQ